MTAQRSVVAGVLVAVAVIAAFWFMVLAPEKETSARLQDQVAQARARLEAATTAVQSAQTTRANYQREYATVARLGKAVPADDDVASLLYQVESVARSNKIDFRSAKLSSGPAATPTPVAAPADKSASGDKTAAKDAATATTPPVAVVAQAPPGATVGAAGLLTLPFTFVFDGGYMPMQRMLGAIDGLADVTDGVISVRGRLLTVDGFSLSASRKGFPKVKAQVSATAYILPENQSAIAPATSATATSATPVTPAAGGNSGGATPPANATATITGVRP